MLSKESWPPSLPGGGGGGGGKKAGEEGLGRDNRKNPRSEDRSLIRPAGGTEEGRGHGDESCGLALGEKGLGWLQCESCLVLQVPGWRFLATGYSCLSEGDSSA